MKINDSFGGIGHESNDISNGYGRVKSASKLKFAARIIFVLLLVLVSGTVIFQIFKDSHRDVVSGPEASFTDCTALKENCNDIDCEFYSYCGDGEHKSCKVYDCGKEYGIYAVDMNGIVNAKRETKLGEEAAKTQAMACKGKMEILDENCVDNETQATVRISPNGVCPIEGFMIFFENEGAQSTGFTRLGNDTFLLTSARCGKISKIVPSAEGGVSLDAIRFIPV